MQFTQPVFKRFRARDGLGLFCALFCLTLTGCASAVLGNMRDPEDFTRDFASDAWMEKHRIPAKDFNLVSYERTKAPAGPLTVYIEGDGRAWINHSTPAQNPTPHHPMLIKLAAMDPAANVVYLARPCQYDGSSYTPPCGEPYWTNKRFSEEVIASMNEALNVIKDRDRVSEFHLVGYSGGAAVAMLVAARRDDISSIRTIAGNLDPEAVNKHHGVDPLDGSLDPMDVAAKVAAIPQRHFVGGKDKLITPDIAENFKKAAGGNCMQITPVDEASHHEGWEDRWELLLKLPVSCG